MDIVAFGAMAQCLGVVVHRLPLLAIRVLLEVEHMLVVFPEEDSSAAVRQVVEEDIMVAQEAFEVVRREVEVASVLRALEEEHTLVVGEVASSW